MKTKRHSRPSYWLLSALLLISCSSQSNRFKVDGVDGEFCVPPGYPPQGVWFVPKDAPGTPNGFSFMGCGLIPQEKRAACTLPEEFISAHVDPLSQAVKRSHTWNELKDAAGYDMSVHKPGAEYSIDPETGMLVLFNKNIWEKWSIWKRGQVQGDALPLVMRDSDELVVSCSEVENYPGGTGGQGSKGEFACDRYVQGSRYALNYQFISKQRVPTEPQLKALEARLFDQVEHWRCPTK